MTRCEQHPFTFSAMAANADPALRARSRLPADRSRPPMPCDPAREACRHSLPPSGCECCERLSLARPYRAIRDMEGDGMNAAKLQKRIEDAERRQEQREKHEFDAWAENLSTPEVQQVLDGIRTLIRREPVTDQKTERLLMSCPTIERECRRLANEHRQV